jgi:LysM repeat protein
MTTGHTSDVSNWTRKDTAMTANPNTRIRRTPIKRQIVLVMLGVGLLLIVLLLIYSASGSGNSEADAYISILDERVALLEKQVADLSSALETLTGPHSPGSQLERLNTTCQRLEASLTLKSNLLAERMDNMEALIRNEKAVQAKAVPSVTPAKLPTPKPAPDKKEVQPAKAKPVYHVVEKGDTFYSISRRYGITLKRLKELNKFNEKTIIHPGQKVIVSP